MHNALLTTCSSIVGHTLTLLLCYGCMSSELGYKTVVWQGCTPGWMFLSLDTTLVLVKRKLCTCSIVLRWNAEYCGGALGGRESEAKRSTTICPMPCSKLSVFCFSSTSYKCISLWRVSQLPWILQ